MAPKSISASNVHSFFFDKKENGWKQLQANTTIHFEFAPDSASVAVAGVGRQRIDHAIELASDVPSSVVKTQSWVFRAVDRVSTSRDVLCVQFLDKKDASQFVAAYRLARSSALAARRGDEDSLKDASALDHGMDLSKAMHAELYISSPTKHLVDADGAPTPEQTRVMRRRLSTQGVTQDADGHTPNARNEPKAHPSPVKSTLLSKSLTRNATTSGRRVPKMVSFSGLSQKGEAPYNPDKPNQDAMIMHQLPKNDFCSGEVLFAVFDGHGAQGHLVSSRFRVRLPQLLSRSRVFKNDVGKALCDALTQIEVELMDDPDVNTTLSGTTAVVSVLKDNVIVTANVGDSRIIRGRRRAKNHQSNENGGSVSQNLLSAFDEPEAECLDSSLECVEISTDHKPDDPAEQARIEKAGGRVFAMKYDDGIDGPARVWLSYSDMPGLAMSRSLCDTIGKEAGVISTPDVTITKLTAEDEFVILASDGLWEFMPNERVVEIASAHKADPRVALEKLVAESTALWKTNEPVVDDTTAIIAYFV